MKKEKPEKLDLYSFLQKYPIRNKVLLTSMIKSKYSDILFNFDMSATKLVSGYLIMLSVFLMVINLILFLTKAITSDTYATVNIIVGLISITSIIILRTLRRLYTDARKELESVEQVIDEIDELSNENQ